MRVLVTGGSRGLGREMALAFADHGAHVVIASRKLENCEAVADEVRAKGRRALAFAYHAASWDDADRLAEAFAEYLHAQARRDWGFGDALSNDALIDEQYRGIRPAPGYPACPDHTEKGTLWKLLDAEKNAGVKLTESFAMWPAAAVSGLYFSHPDARYFGVGKIGKDQLADYSTRKNKSIEEMTRWLRPNLE